MDYFLHTDSCSLYGLWEFVPEGTLCSCLLGALSAAQRELERPPERDMDSFMQALYDAMVKPLTSTDPTAIIPHIVRLPAGVEPDYFVDSSGATRPGSGTLYIPDELR